jgi:uncharacterized protein (TIGR04255 family)
MNKPPLKLKNPPIVEAVLDIDCDLPPNKQLAKLEQTAQEQFTDHYPKPRKMYVLQHKFEAKPDGTSNVSVMNEGVRSLQFLKDDEKQLVQVRTQGFSFNRLAPYSSLDDYLPEIERTWRLYVKLAEPVQVRTIRLRYINRILIPLTKGSIELEAYFKTGPRLPDEEKLKLLGFLIQHSAIEVDTEFQVNTVLTLQRHERSELPIIFDNCVAAPGSEDPEDWSGILGKIRDLRTLKNHVFERTLTKECMKLFQ